MDRTWSADFSGAVGLLYDNLPRGMCCVAMPVLLRALATALPPLRVTSEEAYAFFSSRFALAPAEDALYRRLLLDGPVRGRHLGMDSVEEALETDPDRLHARFLLHARRTAAAAARGALSSLNLRPGALGAIVVNTCTGYACPGLSSYLAEDLGLSRDVRATDIAGMGCGAALPNLECAAGLLAVDGSRPVLSVAVEICSATLFMGPDPGLIVSNCIFGDSAAAGVLGVDGAAAARFEGFASVLAPEHREALRYRQEGGRLRNHLTLRVPAIGARLGAEALDRLLASSGRKRSDIRWWAVHAGGTAVLDEVGERLGLSDDDLRFSQAVFRDYANMSSPAVLFGLENILRDGRPAAGDLGVLLAFGAGFSAYAALVEFTGAA